MAGWSGRSVAAGLLAMGLLVGGCAAEQDVPTATPQPLDSGDSQDSQADEADEDAAEAEDATTDASAGPQDDATDPDAGAATEGSEDDDAEPALVTGDDALGFFRSTEPICAAHAEETGNSRVPPEHFAGATVAEQVAEQRWVIEDGEGSRLVVDLAQEIVHSEDGPDGVLPPRYSFGCPPDLYRGTLPS